MPHCVLFLFVAAGACQERPPPGWNCSEVVSLFVASSGNCSRVLAATGVAGQPREVCCIPCRPHARPRVFRLRRLQDTDGEGTDETQEVNDTAGTPGPLDYVKSACITNEENAEDVTCPEELLSKGERDDVQWQAACKDNSLCTWIHGDDGGVIVALPVNQSGDLDTQKPPGATCDESRKGLQPCSVNPNSDGMKNPIFSDRLLIGVFVGAGILIACLFVFCQPLEDCLSALNPGVPKIPKLRRKKADEVEAMTRPP